MRPEGWVNTDSSLNANLQRIPFLKPVVTSIFGTRAYESNNFVYMDLNKRWKYKDKSVHIVYASHLFEHLKLQSAELMLRESLRVLVPGGVLRLVVPDIYQICKHYISRYEGGDSKASEYLMWAFNMHREGQYGTDINFLKKTVLEWQGYPHQHKFMYDKFSLTERVSNVGFVDSMVMKYGESLYMPECIKDVEGDKESYLSVYLEAKKPGGN